MVSKNIKGREIGIAYNITLNNDGVKHPLYHKKPKIFDAFASHLDHITTLPKNLKFYQITIIQFRHFLHLDFGAHNTIQNLILNIQDK